MFVSSKDKLINKHLINAFNQPWLIEPDQAQKWAMIALDLLSPSSITTPVSNYSNSESVPYIKNNVMVLPVNGPLMKYESCGSPGTSNMLASLQQANANDAVDAIVLQIDSPGGTVDGTQVFADAVKASKKPVVAYVDGMMASAAMWIGSAASQVIASTNTDMVGSIGTMIQWADFSEAYKAKGVAVHTAYATASTDKNRMISNASTTGNYTELITSLLDPVNDQFTSAIQNNRAGKINLNKENVLTGKTYMAKDAVKHGLVDKIGSLDMAITSAKKLASQKQKQTMEANTAFKNVLNAANAPSFELVDNIGFALTEEQMTAVDTRLQTLIACSDAAEAAADVQQTAITTLTEQLAAANNEVLAAGIREQALTARLAEYGVKPAAGAGKIPGASADPGKAETFLTSVDLEKQAMKNKYGK